MDNLNKTYKKGKVQLMCSTFMSKYCQLFEVSRRKLHCFSGLSKRGVFLLFFTVLVLTIFLHALVAAVAAAGIKIVEICRFLFFPQF